jgi:hypothetical protein
MLAAIQSMPPAEKRAMLVSALKRALPIMMQTAQVRDAQGWAVWCVLEAALTAHCSGHDTCLAAALL